MAYAEQRYGTSRFSVPKNWVDNSMINFVGPPTGSARPSLVITNRSLPGNPSLESFAKNQKAALLEANLPGFELLDEGPVVHGDRKFFRLSFSWLGTQQEEGSEAAQPLRQEQYYLLGAGRALTLTLSCAPDVFDKMKPVFSDMIKNTFLDEGKE